MKYEMKYVTPTGSTFRATIFLYLSNNYGNVGVFSVRPTDAFSLTISFKVRTLEVGWSSLNFVHRDLQILGPKLGSATEIKQMCSPRQNEVLWKTSAVTGHREIRRWSWVESTEFCLSRSPKSWTDIWKYKSTRYVPLDRVRSLARGRSELCHVPLTVNRVCCGQAAKVCEIC